MTVWDDIRFAAQVSEDQRSTILYPPGLDPKVQAALDQLRAEGFHDVQESPHLPNGQIVIIDHHAIEAATRQETQLAAKIGVNGSFDAKLDWLFRKEWRPQ